MIIYGYYGFLMIILSWITERGGQDGQKESGEREGEGEGGRGRENHKK